MAGFFYLIPYNRTVFVGCYWVLLTFGVSLIMRSQCVSRFRVLYFVAQTATVLYAFIEKEPIFLNKLICVKSCIYFSFWKRKNYQWWRVGAVSSNSNLATARFKVVPNVGHLMVEFPQGWVNLKLDCFCYHLFFTQNLSIYPFIKKFSLLTVKLWVTDSDSCSHKLPTNQIFYQRQMDMIAIDVLSVL